MPVENFEMTLCFRKSCLNKQSFKNQSMCYKTILKSAHILDSHSCQIFLCLISLRGYFDTLIHFLLQIIDFLRWTLRIGRCTYRDPAEGDFTHAC